MAIDQNGLKFLLLSKAKGVDFSNTAMIGRQRLNLTPDEFKATLDQCCISYNEASVRSVMYDNDHYSDVFFKTLGAMNLTSLDYSDYEGATVIHDMNHPVPDELKSRFSVVLDGGSLEHVFNFPIAIQNCMKMVAPGGHFMTITPVNNFMGHGFYQFSPELFFSLLNQNNGFEIQSVLIFEDRPNAEWYQVVNPSSIGGRVTLINLRPTYLVVIARRVSQEELTLKYPSQSDYVPIWEGASSSPSVRPVRGKILSTFLKLTPAWAKEFIKSILSRWKSRHVFNRIFFSPFDWASQCHGLDSLISFQDLSVVSTPICSKSEKK